MLSGGNQQKIVIGRWLFAEAELFILDEPTQGIDIGAKVAVYKLINRLTATGRAVILISSDHDELLAMSDRIGIMSHGRMVEVRAATDVTKTDLVRASSERADRGERQHEKLTPSRDHGPPRGLHDRGAAGGGYHADLPRSGQHQQPDPAGLNRRNRGGRLDHRDFFRRHRSVARLHDRVDDCGLCHGREALERAVRAGCADGPRSRHPARTFERHDHRLWAHPFLHHHAGSTLGLSRSGLHVQQRLAGEPGLALARADLLRQGLWPAPAPLLRRRPLRRRLLVPALHGNGPLDLCRGWQPICRASLGHQCTKGPVGGLHHRRFLRGVWARS